MAVRHRRRERPAVTALVVLSLVLVIATSFGTALAAKGSP